MFTSYVKFDKEDIKDLCEQALAKINEERERQFQRAVTALVHKHLRESKNPSLWKRLLCALKLAQPIEAITREDAEHLLAEYKEEVWTYSQMQYAKINHLKTAVEASHYRKVFMDSDLYAMLKEWTEV